MKPIWSSTGKSTSNGADTHTPPDDVEHRPRRDEHEPDRGLGDDRDPLQGPAAQCPRDSCRRQRPGHGDPDVGEREPLRAVRVEEDRVRDDQEERFAEAERERLARQQRRHAPRGRRAHSSWGCAGSGVLGARPETGDEHADDGARQLGTVGQKLVQNDLAHAQQQRLLDRRHRCRARLGHQHRRALRPRSRRPARRACRSPRCTRTRPLTTT